MQIRKLRKQAKMIKQRKNAGRLDKKEKSNSVKNNNTTWGNQPESTYERRKIKKISRKGKNDTDKTEHSKTTKENSTYLGEMTWKYNNNRMQEKLNNFGV